MTATPLKLPPSPSKELLSSTSFLLKRLGWVIKERGLVARKRDPSDRRRHLVTLTPSGKEKLSELRAISKRLDKEFFAPLDVQQRETLHELLVELAGYHDARFAPAKK